MFYPKIPLKKLLALWSFVLALGTLGCNHLFSQEGSLDTSFQSPIVNSPVTVISAQADGKVLFGYSGTTGAFVVSRLNSDGSSDASFNSGAGPESIVAGTVYPGTVAAFAPLAEGKILVGGNFTHFNKIDRKLLVRLNANGSVDTSFNQGTGFVGDNVSGIVVASNGKIYVSGKYTKVDGVSRSVGLVRLNADGSLDNSFADSTIFFGANIYSFSLQPDGKPLVNAAYANASYQATMQVYRLGLNGGLDSAFAQGTGSGYAPGPILHGLMSNGQILVTGGTGLYNGVNVNKSLFRLNSDGTLDTSFPGLDLKYSNTTGMIGRFLSTPDGRFYISGAFDKVAGQTRTGLARLKADGTLDPAFVPGGYVSTSPGALALQGDGKILAGSTLIVGVDVRYNIIRLNGSGGTSPTGPQIGSMTLLPGGLVQLQVSGATSPVVIEASADLITWSTMITNSVAGGVITFTDPLSSQSNARFYKLRGPP